ncbi:hypothetical protein GOP47_0026938 [Adiantum capillus-veneris]|nr:hypothetical protein GOP47_0026938 [Adiantum capillus-veneris]
MNSSINDFTILRQVGEGGFGKVYQVQHKLTHRIFALKSVNIAKFRSIRDERHILSRLQLDPHPHILRLWDSFLSSKQAHLLLDFLDGGDLLSQLEEDGPFVEAHARSCLAEIVSAVAHLHSHGILHRDIKPENILLDYDGHVKLTDFGLAVDIIGCQSLEESGKMRSSPCGTYFFMAPEMLQGKEYGFALDWWSVGVLFFEMVAGCLPFGKRGCDIDEDKVCQEVLTRRPRLPTYLSRDAHSLLKGLLHKDPNKRLRTAHDIKEHPWFKNIDWTKLEYVNRKCDRICVDKQGEYLHRMNHRITSAEKDIVHGQPPSPSSTATGRQGFMYKCGDARASRHAVHLHKLTPPPGFGAIPKYGLNNIGSKLMTGYVNMQNVNLECRVPSCTDQQPTLHNSAILLPHALNYIIAPPPGFAPRNYLCDQYLVTAAGPAPAQHAFVHDQALIRRPPPPGLGPYVIPTEYAARQAVHMNTANIAVQVGVFPQ